MLEIFDIDFMRVVSKAVQITASVTECQNLYRSATICHVRLYWSVYNATKNEISRERDYRIVFGLLKVPFCVKCKMKAPGKIHHNFSWKAINVIAIIKYLKCQKSNSVSR